MLKKGIVMLSSRLGDTWVGVCCCNHDGCVGMTGIVITSAARTEDQFQLTARLGDITIGNCGHTGIICSGASKINIEGVLSARISDCVTGCNKGVLVTGASKIDHQS